MNVALILAVVLAAVLYLSIYSGRLAWRLSHTALDAWGTKRVGFSVVDTIFAVLGIALFLLVAQATIQLWGLALFGGILAS